MSDSKGFTLIEIIVTVAIIGTIVAVIGVQLGRDVDRLARLDARHFQMIVNEVRNEAVIAGQFMALKVSEKDGYYQFLKFDDGWQEVSDGALYKRRTPQQSVTLSWQLLDSVVDSEELTSLREEDSEEEAEQQAERDRLNEEDLAFISPYGEISRFALSFQGDNSRYVVTVDERGEFVVNAEQVDVF